MENRFPNILKCTVNILQDPPKYPEMYSKYTEGRSPKRTCTHSPTVTM